MASSSTPRISAHAAAASISSSPSMACVPDSADEVIRLGLSVFNTKYSMPSIISTVTDGDATPTQTMPKDIRYGTSARKYFCVLNLGASSHTRL